MSGKQRLALILTLLAIAYPTATTAVADWLSLHPTITFTTAAIALTIRPTHDAVRGARRRSVRRSFAA